MYIGWPGLVHGARVLANSDFYCQGEDHANRSPWTRNSSCSALQPVVSDEAVATERSHDLKFDYSLFSYRVV